MNGVKVYRDPYLPFFELKMCNTSALSYKKHVHEEYTLGLVEQGESILWYEGKVARVFSKTFVSIPPNMIHACNPVHSDLWKYKMLYVSSSWVKRFIAREENPILNNPIIINVSEREVFHKINSMMENLSSDTTPLDKEASIMAVFEEFQSGEKKICNLSSKKDYTKIKVIKDYLHDCFLERVTLDQLEQISSLNKFHIIRLFKDTFNIPPHTYQTLLRINYAKKELCKDRPIAQIALEAGFYDQSHFIKVFKSHTGVTPDKYQKLK